MKEDLREKSKTSLEKTGNIETEANELLRGKKIDVLEFVLKPCSKSCSKQCSKQYSNPCPKNKIDS